MKLRTGRKLARTIYIQFGDEPSGDDELLGMAIDPARGALLVQIANGERPSLGTPDGASPAQKLLGLGLPDHPSGCDTVRDYLRTMLAQFFLGEAGFKYGMSGSSDWQYDLYVPMIKAGLLPGYGTWEDDGYGLDTAQAQVLDDLILSAIREMR